MKKITKLFLSISVLTAIPAISNHLIFDYADRHKKKSSREFYYDWHFGKIRYMVVGHGEPLLLLHDVGTSSSLLEWEKNIQSLSQHYRVYALDFLGFGHSDKPGISYSSYMYVRLICDFITCVIGGKTNVVASSHSGALAVAAYSFNPSLFKKFLLISPAGVSPVNGISPDCALWLKRFMELPIFGTFFYNVLTSRTAIRWLLMTKAYQNEEPTREMVEAIHNDAHTGGVGAKYPLAAFLGNHLNTDLISALLKVKIPIATLWGSNNTDNPVENFAAMERVNPGLSLTVFENTRKLPHSEKPKAFFKLCREFFK